MQIKHKLLVSVGIGFCILSLFGYEKTQDIKNRSVVNASSVLHMPPKVRKAFSLKRALNNSDKRNVTMRARLLFKALQTHNHLTQKQANVILAIIKSRTGNLKDTKRGYFNINNRKDFKKYSHNHKLNEKSAATQFRYLNDKYHIMNIFNHHKQSSKYALFNRIYQKIFGYQTLNNQRIRKSFQKIDMKN